ncbi:hypothetical protein RND71_004366 [Anisodus tanguticus]|uniref:Uncharacterized protein n=1 Tax=Anisodus tanguticus TaxID=243964 RepID=A0AAE1VXN1_9SOLA|nr:hypothetical protein RND71_004366 [Anisodus tanguticus]
MGNCQSTPEFHCFSLCTRLLHANSEIDTVTSLAPSSVSRSSNTTVFYQVSCPSLEELVLSGLDRITALCSHQLPTGYFSKLETLEKMHKHTSARKPPRPTTTKQYS